MIGNNKVRMVFTCSQDWELLKPTDNGKHCEVCQKNVIDFSNKSINEIDRISEGKELCGMFLSGQVKTDMIALDALYPKGLSKFILSLTTVLGLHVMQAKAQEPVVKNSVETSDSQDLRLIRLDGRPNKKPDACEIQKPIENIVTKQPPKSKYYLTWRFPFVVKRRIIIRTVGRFRI